MEKQWNGSWRERLLEGVTETPLTGTRVELNGVEVVENQGNEIF